MSRVLRTAARVLVLLLVFGATKADAAVITLAWDPNTETDLAGYIVQYSSSPGVFDRSADVGLTTTWSFVDAVVGTTYYFRVVAYNRSGLVSLPSNVVSETAGVSDPVPTPDTRVSVNRTALRFAAVQSGGVITSAQTVSVNFADGTSTWTASTTASWLEILDGAGTGAGTFSVRVRPGTYPPGFAATTSIAVAAPGVVNSPVSVPVTFRSLLMGANPSGTIDTPVDNATGLAGAIPITGWVVDDVEATEIALWRDGVPGEASGQIFIGNAMLVDGSRPDIDAAFDTPFDYRAGWGYMLLTNTLPNGGNGPYRLHAYARDKDGHQVLLGSRSITCSNATATKPFGTIDTPAQGGTASGSSYTNWGWVLTPQPNMIPTDGSTIMVYIDGVPVGRPTYNLFRSDLAAIFPGLANSNGAAGRFIFDTTTLANGVHTIVWGVTDNAGNAQGIGSRYFTVQNTATSSSLSVATDASVQALSTGVEEVRHGSTGGDYLGELPAVLGDVSESQVPVYARHGFSANAPLELLESHGDGAVDVATQETQRFELTLGSPVSAAGKYEGYVVSGNRLHQLPTGAFLDRHTGHFYWQPGVGFVGTYDLLFVRSDAGVRQRIAVRVTIAPRSPHDR